MPVLKLRGLPGIEDELEVVNPYWVLKKLDGKKNSWPSGVAKTRKRVTYAHGDFHAGNVLVEFFPWMNESDDMGLMKTVQLKRTVVLDFDYVEARLPPEYDRATIETSFVLAIARAASAEGIAASCEDYGRLFRTVRSRDSIFAARRYENDRFVYDIGLALEPIVPISTVEESYPEFRAIALLRLLSSYYHDAKRSDELGSSSLALWTCWLWTGLSLARLGIPRVRAAVIDFNDEALPDWD